ncbi:MAG: hypothetical protein JXA13_17595 [Anaerolineales bacterium]|nr:hypothetical protein [Anaerolineales bacterium]
MNTTKSITQLTLLIIILAFIAAGAGVFWQGQGETFEFTSLRGETITMHGRGLYQFDSVSYVAQAVAQDIVTLVLGLPLLAAGILLTRKGSLRGRLLLTGTLGYMLYTYTSYTFLVAYNQFFLLYVALFSACLFAFILSMKELDPELVKSRISEKFPRLGIVLFLSVIAAFLTLAWSGRILPALAAGIPPVGLESYTTLVIQALDLGIIVPASALTAVLLWKKQPWGYTLSAVLLIKGLTLGAALVAMIINMLLAGLPANAVEIVMFTCIASAALLFTLFLFRSIQEPE